MLAQRVLEAIFGDQAVRDMAAKARRRLLELTDTVYAQESQRYAEVLEAHRTPPDQAGSLHAATARLAEVAR